jgi:protease-4
LRRLASRRQQPVVAVVAVEGGIALGRSNASPLGGRRAGSDTVCAALRSAGARDDVAAVVLRVVSPGGSYVASDAIHREVTRLRQQGTPVVASMGSVAASGGYFVAMGADEIVALPSTITGSIGVLGGKVVVGDALRRLGIGTEPVGAGSQATMFDSTVPFQEQEWARVEQWLDAVYADFTAKAASGRQMPYERLEPLARGRVWTGGDARDRGLVDTLGGLDQAVTRAAERVGSSRKQVRVVRVPHPSPLDRLRPAMSSESAAATVWAPAGGAESAAEAVLRQLGAGGGVLSLPGPWRLG